MSTSSFRRATSLVALAVLTAACGSGSKAKGPTSTPAPTTAASSSSSSSSSSTSAAPTTTVSATTTTVKGPPREPFTGLLSTDPAKLDRPALVVKIDNAPETDVEPQVGLDKADIIFEELVEGGVTRFAALFHSKDSDTVGPIRSARNTDVDLLSQFSNPLLAWSGGNPGVSNAVRNSGSIYDIGAESGFSDLSSRTTCSRAHPNCIVPGHFRRHRLSQPSRSARPTRLQSAANR
jgi:hypothetical protein